MTSKFAEIAPPSHRQGNCIPFAAIRWHDFGNRPALGRPFGPVFHHPDTTLPGLDVYPWNVCIRGKSRRCLSGAVRTVHSQFRSFVCVLKVRNQTIGWLQRGCSSLGGGMVVGLPRIWISPGKCRLLWMLRNIVGSLSIEWCRLGDPAADMMFRMASAISQNPDQEFEVKPPPLEVSYEE